MLTDRQSCPLPGATPEAAALFDLSCDRFARFCGDPVQPLDDAIAAAPGFAMARLAKAAIYATSTEPRAVKAASNMLDAAEPLLSGDRDASHFNALRLAVAGNLSAAGAALQHHARAMPRDHLALLIGHQLDFLTANVARLEGRIAEALPHWEGLPGRSFLLGMLAFGLEEGGRYAEAEAAGLAALDAEPDDCWAHHAVAHVMEMQGRAEEARDWIAGRTVHWAQPENFLRIHNWWHLALCHIELGDNLSALRLYDDYIRAERSGVAMNLVDAAALLWRLHLLGTETGDRWTELADAWARHADGNLYPFNDMHAAFALIGAGRDAGLSDLLPRVATPAESETAVWMQQIGQPLLTGLVAFRNGDNAEAARLLYPLRLITGAFGGSHAQRDVIHWTLTEAAIRAGNRSLAAQLVEERLRPRPHSAVNLALKSRLAAVGESLPPA